MKLLDKLKHLFGSTEIGKDIVKKNTQSSDMSVIKDHAKKSTFPQGESFEEGEYETIAVIAASCVAREKAGVKYRVRSIQKIDIDQKLAGIITAAVLAQDKPESSYRIHSITRVK